MLSFKHNNDHNNTQQYAHNIENKIPAFYFISITYLSSNWETKRQGHLIIVRRDRPPKSAKSQIK